MFNYIVVRDGVVVSAAQSGKPATDSKFIDVGGENSFKHVGKAYVDGVIIEPESAE